MASLVELHVLGAPVGSAAADSDWQASLAEPHKPWKCRLSGWALVTGMPAAMVADATYDRPTCILKNQAALACAKTKSWHLMLD